MQPGEPSRTALGAARHRAAHQLLEQGFIFTDPLAVRILGENPQSIIDDAQQNDAGRRMRIFIAARTRLAEDWLAAAITGGVTQLVVLGAGLDTYAYRGGYQDTLRIFEIDHPATQAWKRQRLIEAAIPIPPSLTYAPIDFERETLADGLHAAGFDTTQPTFFTWLGVVPYLTPDAFWSTLRFISRVPNRAHVVFDYSDPPDSLSPEMRAVYEERAARVAALGEPWVNHFEAETLHPQLKDAGFRTIEDFGPREIAARFFPQRAASMPAKGGHILHAATVVIT
jgi:methyltransferase (TIGR00027 family)